MNEVSYTKIPLPAFLEKYTFSGEFRQLLEEKRRSEFREQEFSVEFLNEDERKFVSDYFRMIGKSDASSQKTYLTAMRGEINEKKRESAEEYKKYFSLYMKLGFLAGLILVVLIV